MSRARRWAPMLILVAALAGCRQPSMYDHPVVRQEEYHDFIRSGQWRRAPVPGTTPWGGRDQTDAFHTGMQGDRELTYVPLPVTPALVARGQERFEIFCAECHGRLGNGQGMVPHRGFPAPPSYLEPRLLKAPIGHFVNVIANGSGAMFSYADRVPAADRWAIAVYIRALQLAGNARLSELPAADRRKLEALK